MPSAARSRPARPRELAGVRQPPLHALIGEIGEGMAERRQLPIEHGEQARARMARRSYCRCASRHAPARRGRRRRACSRRASRSAGPCRHASSFRWRDIARPSAAIDARNNCRACRSRRGPPPATSTACSLASAVVHRIVDGGALSARACRAAPDPKRCARRHGPSGRTPSR